MYSALAESTHSRSVYILVAVIEELEKHGVRGARYVCTLKVGGFYRSSEITTVHGMGAHYLDILCTENTSL